MARYRVLEIRDKLIYDGRPHWVVEKKIFGLWWTQYFEEHSEWGATFYNKEKAITWYEYHCNNDSRIKTKVIAQNK